MIVDAENVRGKKGFKLDHANLLDRLLVWASMCGHAGRTIVVVDHGNEPGAHLLRGGAGPGGDDHRRDGDLCVLFTGSRIKANDVIARDVQWLLLSSSSSPPSPSPSWLSSSRRRRVVVVVVVTADRELGWRCRCVAVSAARGRARQAAAADDDEDDDAGGVGCDLHLPLKVTILHRHDKD